MSEMSFESTLTDILRIYKNDTFQCYQDGVEESEKKIKDLESKLAKVMDALRLGVDMCLLELQNDPAEHSMVSWLENVAKPTLEEIGEKSE